MLENSYPKFRVGAVQAGPVFMDREATVDKACRLIQEAGNNGARLVAFPEAFIPAYPYWSRYLPPLQSVHYTKELIKQAVQIPSHTTELLAQAARNSAVRGVRDVVEFLYFLPVIFETPNSFGHSRSANPYVPCNLCEGHSHLMT